MEATIKSNNKAINIGINVSINVCALKANIQRGLQASKQRVLQAVKQATKQGALTLPRLYSKELRLANAVARAIAAHPTLSNLWIGGWTIAGIYLIFTLK